MQPWPLNDDTPIKATVLVLVGTASSIVDVRSQLSNQLQFPLAATAATVPSSASVTRGFVSGLPTPIHLLNVFVRSDGIELVRQHRCCRVRCAQIVVLV